MATSVKRPAGRAPGRSLAKPHGHLPAGLRQGQPFDSRVVVALMKDPELCVPEIVSMFTFSGGDPEATAESIAAQDFSAKSLDELLGGGDAVGSKEFVDRPFSLTSVSYNVADQDGLPFYAVLHGVTGDGELVHVTSGARNVVRKAALADANGWLPAWVVIRSTETKAGRTALSLESAPKSDRPF